MKNYRYCNDCGHQVTSAKPNEEWQLNALVERICDHFGYPTKPDKKTWLLKIKSSSLANLTLNSPKGNQMIIFYLQYVSDEAIKQNNRKRQGERNLDEKGWMIWDIQTVFPDSLNEIRKATKV